MSEKVDGNFYTATIDKSNVGMAYGKPLGFRIDITCEDSVLFKELIVYIDDFYMNKYKPEGFE